jgi:hypothetical protein
MSVWVSTEVKKSFGHACVYVASNVRNLNMDKANAKEKSFVSSVRRRAMMVTLVKMIINVPIVANPVWPLLKTVNFT